MSQQENKNPIDNNEFEIIREIPKLDPSMGFYERLYWKEMKQIGEFLMLSIDCIVIQLSLQIRKYKCLFLVTMEDEAKSDKSELIELKRQKALLIRERNKPRKELDDGTNHVSSTHSS